MNLNLKHLDKLFIKIDITELLNSSSWSEPDQQCCYTLVPMKIYWNVLELAYALTSLVPNMITKSRHSDTHTRRAASLNRRLHRHKYKVWYDWNL